MENEAQITNYIKEKQDGTLSWTIENIETEFNNLVWK